MGVGGRQDEERTSTLDDDLDDARRAVLSLDDGDRGAVQPEPARGGRGGEVGVALLRVEEALEVGEAEAAGEVLFDDGDGDLDVGAGGGKALEGGDVGELEHEVVVVLGRDVWVLGVGVLVSDAENQHEDVKSEGGAHADGAKSACPRRESASAFARAKADGIGHVSFESLLVTLHLTASNKTKPGCLLPVVVLEEG